MPKLTSEERETVIVRNRSDDFVSIATTEPVVIGLMDKQGIEPCMSQGNYRQYRVPKNWFRQTSKGWIISPPRAVSEKQRENASTMGRLQAIKKKRVTA